MTQQLIPSHTQPTAGSHVRTENRKTNYDIVKPEELADRLKVPVSWVYDHVRSRTSDPMPCLRFGKYVRFQPDSPEFQEWLARHQSVPTGYFRRKV